MQSVIALCYKSFPSSKYVGEIKGIYSVTVTAFSLFFFCLNYGFFNVFLKEKYPWLFTSGNVFIWAGDSCGEQLNPIAETTESCQFKIKAV